MARVSFTNNLQRHLDCPSVTVRGESVRAILDATFAQNPKLRSYILDDQGALRQHVNIFVNNAAVRDRARLTDPVGESDEIFLFSAHCCHPSLANDNCSGMSVNTHLAQALTSLQGKTRYSYQFIFAPGTIGSITWLSRNEDKIKRIKNGLILSCVGDPGGPACI